MLHIISRYLNSNQIATEVIEYISNNDVCIFLAEAVLILEHLPEKILAKKQKISLYALQQDIHYFGLTDYPAYIKVIDYQQFVDLTIHHTPNKFW
ncbi:MAG: DsrH/TusB family sulfur metabolism protein [Pseudomonadota bacterium]